MNNYVLVRFNQVDGMRQFAFDCVGPDRSRMRVTVQADVTLARKYDIRLQELPLLCRRLLEAQPEEGLETMVTFPEAQMMEIQCAARSVAVKRPNRPAKVSSAVGQAWRNQRI